MDRSTELRPSTIAGVTMYAQTTETDPRRCTNCGEGTTTDDEGAPTHSGWFETYGRCDEATATHHRRQPAWLRAARADR